MSEDGSNGLEADLITSPLNYFNDVKVLYDIPLMIYKTKKVLYIPGRLHPS